MWLSELFYQRTRVWTPGPTMGGLKCIISSSRGSDGDFVDKHMSTYTQTQTHKSLKKNKSSWDRLLQMNKKM